MKIELYNNGGREVISEFIIKEVPIISNFIGNSNILGYQYYHMPININIDIPLLNASLYYTLLYFYKGSIIINIEET